jgi:uncharacterized protein YbjT (DUF2867 family)
MRVLVTGATGLTGRAVVRAARAAGMEVTALTRDPRKLQPAAGLTVVAADLTDVDALRRVLRGHDAVIHCLGVGGRGSGAVTTLLSDATSILLTAMADSGVSRLVALSNVGAGSSIEQGTWLYRRLIRPVVMALFLRWLRPILDDKDRMEPLIMASGLAWTIVRLPNVVGRPPRRTLRLSAGTRSVGLSIGAADLAGFLIASLQVPALGGVAVSVSN